MSVKKEKLIEIYFLRSISCLAIVLTHSIGFSTKFYADLLHSSHVFGRNILDSLNLLLKFGTPMFVFISILLLSYSYRDGIRKGFLFKRFKYIFIPFLIFSGIYSGLAVSGFLDAENRSFGSLPSVLFQHIFLAGFHGYFVVIIFQFYILFYLFKRHLDQWNPLTVITVSFIINIAYLGFFNFVGKIESIPLSGIIWSSFNWLPFVGWLFYFSLAYYCGRNIEQFKALLAKHKIWVNTLPFVLMGIVLFLYHSGVLPVSDSKRIDMLLLTTFLFFGLYQFASRLQRVPRSLLLISDYSFGIYLVHWFYLHLMAQLLQAASLSLGYFTIPVLFLGALTFSIITVYLLNRVRVGKFVVGQIGKGRSATPVQVEHSTTGEVPA
ncbi:acyltransferase family protein [Paenibacillus sp. ACRSA]|uniref:acyltransferase family protein n=1 Tax=Paenibacillus sp. ACRSA TaxID=2918211 RepID=UPI001EF748D5|nr:acyltransferase family protein [Paenibacillus sp. ACRSA]MCG7379306.1 acyltransferase family protein [Paenibacillus sp. ACRSA]